MGVGVAGGGPPEVGVAGGGAEGGEVKEEIRREGRVMFSSSSSSWVNQNNRNKGQVNDEAYIFKG
jgi:hypothetical protein